MTRRPTFRVQHFVACLGCPWDGPPGPDTLRTLEGVGYRHGINADTELPAEWPELWLYARLVKTGGGDGETRPFTLRVVWVDGPGGAVRVSDKRVGAVRLTARQPVASVGWVLRPVFLPGLGRYVIRLLHPVRTWQGRTVRVAGREYFELERKP